jgi:hypothetical protein
VNLVPLLSDEREFRWDQLRRECGDEKISKSDRQQFFENLRAVCIELMLIAITKSGRLDASSDARVFVIQYLNARKLGRIDSLAHDYNRAFGNVGRDGIASMASLFCRTFSNAAVKDETSQRFVFEFYAMYKIFLNDFKSMKLVSAR